MNPEDIHKKGPGKISVRSTVPLSTNEELALAYTPGVARIASVIAETSEAAYTYTTKGTTVAVISDGSAVLGLGNIGPYAAIPVMEGKAAIFSTFADINAVPLCLDTQDTDTIISIVTALAPSFGAINLEDIAAPRCFEIVERLQATLSIPIMHDDQHGTATIVLAGLINALTVTGRTLESTRIVISGAGAAGTAIADILHAAGVKTIIVCDSKGIVTGGTPAKERLTTYGDGTVGTIEDALRGADVCIGVSKGDSIHEAHIAMMNPHPIIFALSNPVPEIYPDVARNAGAAVVATGRSDFPNQLNNALAFPGLFKAKLQTRNQFIQQDFIAAAYAIAGLVEHPNAEMIVPSIFDERIIPAITAVVS